MHDLDIFLCNVLRSGVDIPIETARDIFLFDDDSNAVTVCRHSSDVRIQNVRDIDLYL